MEISGKGTWNQSFFPVSNQLSSVSFCTCSPHFSFEDLSSKIWQITFRNCCPLSDLLFFNSGIARTIYWLSRGWFFSVHFERYIYWITWLWKGLYDKDLKRKTYFRRLGKVKELWLIFFVEIKRPEMVFNQSISWKINAKISELSSFEFGKLCAAHFSIMGHHE